MREQQQRDHRRATAERNVEGILDAAERLLRRRDAASISAVAAEAGLSRVTVYGHFDDRAGLLEAVVERAVRRTMTAIETAEPDRGPAAAALARVLAASWEELGRNSEIAAAAAAELSAEAMRRSHERGRDRIRRLTERGRREGAFRTDVTAEWLVSCFFALVHAARDEVGAGGLDPHTALEALSATIPDLFAKRRVPARRPRADRS